MKPCAGTQLPRNPGLDAPRTPAPSHLLRQGACMPRRWRSGWLSGGPEPDLGLCQALGRTLALLRPVPPPAGIGTPPPACPVDPTTMWHAHLLQWACDKSVSTFPALSSQAKCSLSQTKYLHFRRSACPKKGQECWWDLGQRVWPGGSWEKCSLLLGSQERPPQGGLLGCSALLPHQVWLAHLRGTASPKSPKFSWAELMSQF